MTTKIITLIFGLLALVLEVLLSIKNPTVESITAAGFALIIVICTIISMKRTVTLSEDKPNGKRPCDKAMKLANEIGPYIKEKDGKIYIKVEK